MNEKWEMLPFDLQHPRPKTAPQKPKNLAQMQIIADALAKGFGTARADLYSVGDKIYVGEITLTSSCAGDKFKPFEWDKKWGELWLDSEIFSHSKN